MPIIPSDSRALAFIGPSGCGKSSVLGRLIARGLVNVTPTWTDRPQRPGEEELEHRFVTAKEFSAQAAAGAFAEVVQPFDLPYRYGMPFLEHVPGQVSVVMIRAPFVTLFRKYYPHALVYQLEASYEFASRAVLARSPGGHGTRLSNFDTEIQAGRAAADRTFHNDGTSLETLAGAVAQAMREDQLL